MKKIVSMAVAAAMSLSIVSAVSAADNQPEVYVNDMKISFADQKAVIVDGRTLVPARGVFEAMEATVEWDEEARMVKIYSDDNLTRVYLTIDNANMEVYHFTSIFNADRTDVTLDVAPQIMNDRTMIPLRAISEAMDCGVEWDEEAYSVYIETADYEPYDPAENAGGETAKKAVMSLSSDVDSVSAGDTVDIYINVTNVPSDSYMSGVTALVSYSKTDFKYEGCSLTMANQDGGETSELSAENPDYHDDAVKVAMITLNDSMTEDGVIAKLTFTALTSNGGSFAIKNSYDSIRGYDNSFTATKVDDSNSYEIYGSDIALDTTPVTISGK